MPGKLEVIKEILLHPKEILTEGYQAVMRKRNFVDHKSSIAGKYGCTQLPTIDLLDLFPVFSGVIDAYSFLPDTSMITDILLLKSLAKRYNQCAYLEIGSYRGESIAAVAEVAKECLSITISPDEIRQMGYADDARVQGIFSKNKKNIDYIYHNSLTYDFSKLKRKFDVIFIDGDHSYKSVLQDTMNMYPLLRNDKSVIVWHDYGFDSVNVRHEVLEAILDGTPREYHRHLYHISNTMCAIFIRGDFNTYETQRQEFPNKIFRVEVEATAWTPTGSSDNLEKKNKEATKVQ